MPLNCKVSYAPVALFVYNRPIHTRQTVEALLTNADASKSALYVFSDASRNSSSIKAVTEVRSYIRSITGFKSITIIERENNFGLSNSIIDGVTKLCEEFGRAIVVEDDLQLSPSFLTFMNRALDRYECEEKVFQISGYQFDAPELSELSTAFFLPFTVSWGWATWKRAWDNFDPLASGWDALSRDKALRNRFNLDGAYDYASMLIRQMSGKSDSWAIRWYWSVFRMNGLILFPPVSLVINRGLDGSGSHGRGILREFSGTLSMYSLNFIDLPETIYLSHTLFLSVKKNLTTKNGGRVGFIIDCIRRLF